MKIASTPQIEPVSASLARHQAPTPTHTHDLLPEAIVDVQVANLFEFSKQNDREASRDKFNYWALKAPAIISAAAASAFEAFKIGPVVIVLATIAAVCSAIDAARPRGLLHNAHRKAANEASLAGTALQSGWHLVHLECEPDSNERRTRAAELLRTAQAERKRITDYLTAAETSLGGDAK